MNKYHKKGKFIYKIIYLGIFCTSLISTESIAGDEMTNAGGFLRAGIGLIQEVAIQFAQQEVDPNLAYIPGGKLYTGREDIENQKLPIRVEFPNGDIREGVLGGVLNPCPSLSLLESILKDLLNGNPKTIAYTTLGLFSLSLTAIYTFS